MISAELRAEIKKILDEKLQGTIDKITGNSKSNEGELKPFHEALIPPPLVAISRFERSFSTKLGKFFEEIACLIASSYHQHAEREYVTSGELTTDTTAFIDQSVNNISNGSRDKNWQELVAHVTELASKNGPMDTRSCRWDLRIKTKDERELLFEIKSPKPNKGQCIEVTRNMLQTYAMKHDKQSAIAIYFALTYNPYGMERLQYSHGIALRYLDFPNQVLIGKEFWDMIGGEGTYEELLEIYSEVGSEKHVELERLLES